jgi:hypothetical protein
MRAGEQRAGAGRARSVVDVARKTRLGEVFAGIRAVEARVREMLQPQRDLSA